MKNRKWISVILAALIFVSLLPCYAFADDVWWDEGIWSEEVLLSLGAELPDYDASTGIYSISKPEQLLYMSGLWKTGDSNGDGVADAPCNGYYCLDADLDMTALNEKIGLILTEHKGTETAGYMPPIAASVDKTEEEGIHCGFFGTFDGNGHVISNLRIERMDSKYAGLFGNVGHDFGIGYVKDLALVNATVVGKANAGILCGSLQGDVDNCVVIGSVTVVEKTAGGIAGKVKKNDNGYESNVRNCFIYVDIDVLGQGSENGAAGGVTGAQSNGGRVYDCYVAGDILVKDTGADSVGGITGNLKSGQAVEGMAMLLKSIVTEGGANVGLLVGSYGSESGSHLNKNYVYEGTVLKGVNGNSHPTSAAYEVVTAETLQEELFYRNSLGWNFDSIWSFKTEENVSYPMIQQFADNILVTEGLAERLADNFNQTEPAFRSAEPLVSSAYEGDPVTLSLYQSGINTADIDSVQMLYGNGKDRDAFTDYLEMNGTDDAFSVEIPSLSVGTYYYYYHIQAGNKEYCFPDAGALRLDVVAADAKYAPKYATVTPGETVTSMGINFVTEETALTGEVRHRVKGENDWTITKTDDSIADIGNGTIYGSHSADLTGLKTGTEYEYTLVSHNGEKTYISDISSFETLPDGNAFSFIVISDMQGTSEEAYDPFNYTMNGFVKEQLGGVDFVINLGDMTENDTAAEWSYLFKTIGDVLSCTPVAYVAGNHEYKQSITYENFKALTNLPGGMEDSAIGETTGCFTVGDTCVVIMNTEPYSGEEGADVIADKATYYEKQKEWAKACFEASGCKWRVIVSHAGLIQDDEIATEFLETMCDELGVNLYFNGHIHNYYRANVLNGAKAETGSGTAFITSSPMGLKFDPYGGEIDDVLVYQHGGPDDQRQYFTYVQVDGDIITVTAYQRDTDEAASKSSCASYHVIDTFTLQHQEEKTVTEPKPENTESVAVAEPPKVQEANRPSRTPYIVGGIALLLVVAGIIVALKRKNSK